MSTSRLTSTIKRRSRRRRSKRKFAMNGSIKRLRKWSQRASSVKGNKTLIVSRAHTERKHSRRDENEEQNFRTKVSSETRKTFFINLMMTGKPSSIKSIKKKLEHKEQRGRAKKSLLGIRHSARCACLKCFFISFYCSFLLLRSKLQASVTWIHFAKTSTAKKEPTSRCVFKSLRPWVARAQKSFCDEMNANKINSGNRD